MVKKGIYNWDLHSYPKLMELICAEFEVTEEQMKGKSKIQQLVDARMAFVSIARFQFKNTTSAIGAKINRDHSTVLNLINRMADKEFTKDPVVQKIKKIEQIFKPN